MLNVPTRAQAQKAYRYDPASGDLLWNLPPHFKRAGKKAGWRSRQGYMRANLGGRGCAVHDIIWLLVTGSWPDRDIDHIDRNRSNNRFANLRLATRSQNNANSKVRADNTSGAKGVYWSPSRNRWFAKIVVDGRQICLGYFKAKADACDARRAGAVEYFGEFARSA